MKQRDGPKHLKKSTFRFPKINRLFSKTVVVYCVVYMTHVVERSLDIAESTGIIVANIVTAAAVVFGGELLLLAFKDSITGVASASVEKVKAKVEQAKNTFRDCDEPEE